ncbi:hypothetical protein Nepgr_002733 [Nepenthes gracilis]|uniref:Uncharacterized protein n=1 Tax=Nepenthes gracilis TaxID=150966 RepID=A0AAD3P9Z6_NEPGR|nr:hypothetical protein Nepgr_002733 [Nepenthes gracilis]
MYKATGRVVPLPPSLPGHAIKNPSSPKELVKVNYAAMFTSNSFEILREEDDLSNLGNSVTQINLPSEVGVLDGREPHDACNPRSDPASPGPPQNNISDEVIVTNKVSLDSQPSQICQADSGCNDIVHNDLEKPSACANADTSLIISSGTPICYEDMAINLDSLGALNVCPGSNEPEGGPLGRSTRSRKAKSLADMSSSSGKSVPISGKAREVQEQTKKINTILKNSKGPKISIPPSSLCNG